MSAQADLKLQLMRAIRDWVKSERLTQREAARRLDMAQPAVSDLMRLRSRYALGRLLDAWRASGGEIALRLGREKNAD